MYCGIWFLEPPDNWNKLFPLDFLLCDLIPWYLKPSMRNKCLSNIGHAVLGNKGGRRLKELARGTTEEAFLHKVLAPLAFPNTGVFKTLCALYHSSTCYAGYLKPYDFSNQLLLSLEVRQIEIPLYICRIFVFLGCNWNSHCCPEVIHFRSTHKILEISKRGWSNSPRWTDDRVCGGWHSLSMQGSCICCTEKNLWSQLQWKFGPFKCAVSFGR